MGRDERGGSLASRTDLGPQTGRWRPRSARRWRYRGRGLSGVVQDRAPASSRMWTSVLMIAVRSGQLAGRLTPMTPSPRRLLRAEVLSIGTELTVGETRDTNAGELAGWLTAAGVKVTRMAVLPDDLETVVDALRSALERADLVISTGGLGPTPDDLTREAIASVVGETPSVDPDLERWLRGLWARRRMPFPEMNLKQAWRIPSAIALANPNGTAPGWLVSRADGRVIAALPGPPREMRPMWADGLAPKLAERGLGADIATTTFRLAGIGESQVAELLGEALLRSDDPTIATYARAEAVDVRISAVGRGRRSARQIVDAMASTVLDRIGRYVWATGETTWSQAIGARLEASGWDLAMIEIGTGGSLAALLGDVPWRRLVEIRDEVVQDGPAETADDDIDRLAALAEQMRMRGGTAVGLAIRARPRAHDTSVAVAVITPRGSRQARRTVFLTGPMGRYRAALAATAFLLETLRAPTEPDDST
jgi:competence/damage-inducible protein CinA-like protein